MSLATSSSANNQLQFLRQMERGYNRRGASQYLPRETHNQSPFTTKLHPQATSRIEELMEDFMKKIKQLTKEFTQLDHYAALDILRQHSFFNDVASVFSVDLLARVSTLEEQLAEKDARIADLKKELALKTVEKTSTLQEKDKIKYNTAKSVASNIYYHARGLSEQDFVIFYNRVSLSSNITLKKVQPASRPGQRRDLSQQLEELMKFGARGDNKEQFAEVIEAVKELTRKKQCNRPCCADQKQDTDRRVNKAKTLLQSSAGQGSSHDAYKNDKSEEYFQRYYRGASFNLHDITSVSRTKAQEMQRLQSEYRRNLKQRNRKREVRLHRYSQSFAHPS